MPRKKRERIEYTLKIPAGEECWHICWSENRRSKRVSTGTTDEAAAGLLALFGFDLEGYAQRPGQQQQAKSQA